MKRKYQTPKAVFIDYSFDDNVVAASATCSGSMFVFQTPTGCDLYKFTDYQTAMRMSHPCDMIVEGTAYADPY